MTLLKANIKRTTKICTHTYTHCRYGLQFNHASFRDDEKRRKIQEKTFWMDHTSYAHSLRTAALQGHEMCSSHIRPDCNVKHFSVYLSEWKDNKRQHCWTFIHLSISKKVVVCFTKTYKSFTLFPVKEIFLKEKCFYPLTRKTLQSFLRDCVLSEAPILIARYWFDMFGYILACHKQHPRTDNSTF